MTEPLLAGRRRSLSIMAMTTLFTADDLLAMGSDAPYELIRGELRDVSPSGAKATMIAGFIYVQLFLFVKSRALGYISTTDGGYILSRDPDTLVAPDVAFIARQRIPADFSFDHFFPVPPDLAVEVLSPSNRPGQVAEKVRLYQEAGVPLIWVVDPRKQSVTVHRLGQESLVAGVETDLDGAEILPGLRLAVAELFRVS
jgi:Uma2 family endonuclease